MVQQVVVVVVVASKDWFRGTGKDFERESGIESESGLEGLGESKIKGTIQEMNAVLFIACLSVPVGVPEPSGRPSDSLS